MYSLEHRVAHGLGHLVLPMLYEILTMLNEKILYHVTIVTYLNICLSPTGSAQIRCFTTPSSAGELNCGTADGESEAASIEECCLSPNGQFFEPQAGTDGCTACIGI